MMNSTKLWMLITVGLLSLVSYGSDYARDPSQDPTATARPAMVVERHPWV